MKSRDVTEAGVYWVSSTGDPTIDYSCGCWEVVEYAGGDCFREMGYEVSSCAAEYGDREFIGPIQPPAPPK